MVILHSSDSRIPSAPAPSVATGGAGQPDPPSQSWHTFLAKHAQAIWAADMFVVQTLTFQTLNVLLLISHDRRCLLHFNVTAHLTAARV